MSHITLDLSDEGREELDKLKKLLGCGTDQEVIEVALTLLATAACEVAEGRSIASVDEIAKEFNYMSLPALEHIVRNRITH